MANGEKDFDSLRFRNIIKRYEEAQLVNEDIYMEPEELTDIAEFYYDKGNISQAIKAINLAIKLFPSSTLPVIFRARLALLEEHDSALAEKYADMVCDKSDLDYYYLIAEIMIVNKQTAMADRYLHDRMEYIDEDDIADFILDVATIFVDYEKYDIAFYETELAKRHEPIHQYSIYYDNNISWSKSLQTRIGVHFVGYNPQKHRSYNSIQPRFSIIYSPSKADAVYVNFSKMEQFYHYLKVGDMALPTDFRMPSIGKFKPRQSEHYETGWKHFLKNGSFEISAYLKTRRNVAALRPWDYQEELDNEYIMTGNGNSYGAKFYLYNKWKRWTFQLSYTFARSMERFNDINDGENVPSLYDIPHQANGAVTYKLTDRSSLSLGGQLHSGRIIDNYMDEQTGENLFRSKRENLKYRIDIGYAYKRSFGKKLLLVRAGFYNLIGNPSEEDILNFYSVSFNSRIRPYGSISFKF